MYSQVLSIPIVVYPSCRGTEQGENLAVAKGVDGGGDGVNKTQQLERLVSQGLDAGSSIMIGDRHFDILAARANGIRSVGVTWGFADENEFSDAAPDYIVDSPAELLRLFT